MVEAVKNLYYDKQMSQVEVAQELGVTNKVIWKLMVNHQLATRPQVKRNQFGTNNTSWRGDNARYEALHVRVNVSRGKPKLCVRCGETDPAARYEWANLTGEYTNVNDYERMCVACHRKFDAKRRLETGERTSPTRGGDAQCPTNNN